MCLSATATAAAAATTTTEVATTTTEARAKNIPTDQTFLKTNFAFVDLGSQHSITAIR